MSENQGLPGIEQLIKSEERIAEARSKLKGKDLEAFERSVEMAEGIKVILLAVDLATQDRHMTAAELKEMAGTMRDRNSTLAAWPFPETLNLSSKRELELDVFDAIVDLFEAREKWRERRDEKPFATGEDILKQLGEIVG